MDAATLPAPTTLHSTPTKPSTSMGGGPSPVRSASASRLLPRRSIALLRSAPLTVVLLLAMVAGGALTATLWAPIADGSPLVASLAYGPQALRSGHLQRFLTGALLAPSPAWTVAMLLLVAGALGFLERRIGGLRAGLVLVAAHLAGTVGAAAVVLAADWAGMPATQPLAQQQALGVSAGAFGALAAGTSLMSPVLRARIRWAVGGFVVIMLVRSGTLVDLERVIGFGAGLALGPLVAARTRPAAPVGSDTRWVNPRVARIRGRMALLLVLVPVTSVVLGLAQGADDAAGPISAAGEHRLVAGLVQLGIAVAIAKAVRRGLPGGWWAALVFCTVPLVAAAGAVVTRQGGGHTLGDLACWATVLLMLLSYRRCWPLRLPTGTFRRHLPRVAFATVVFAGAWWVVLLLVGPALGIDAPHRLPEVLRRTVFSGGAAHGPDRWTQFAVGMSGWIWACVLVVLLLPALYEARTVQAPTTHRRRPAASPGTTDPMPEMVQRHGGGSLGWQRTWPGLSTWTNRAADVAIGYRPVSGVAIALGDPVGPTDRWSDAVEEFRRFCLHAGWTVCWYAVTDEFRGRCGSQWRTLQIGEDAVMSLANLEFRGKTWQDVRTARNHAARDGVEMRAVAMDDVSDELRAQIVAVSRGWADEKPLPEMGFTLGTVDHARDPEMRTHIAIDRDGVVHGVTTWLPVHRDGIVVGWTLDVMRRRIGGFRPVIEFLIAESALRFRAEGFETLSLSVAPLARCTEPATGSPLDRVLDRFSRLLEPCYGFRSLLDFKRKFHPEFSPVYLGYSDEIDLSEISLAIGKAYLPHLTPRQALRVVRALYVGHRKRG